ncbi:MAG: RnfABCDGE type electron transport complex subunit B [Thermodesulfobacteriota bacterium]
MSTGILISSVVSMGGIGAVLAAFLAVADKKLRVEEDPRIEALVEILPSTNCGGCGFAGCRSFAEELLKGKAVPTGCVAAGDAMAIKLARLLGVEVSAKKRNIAVVLCNGGTAEARRDAEYRGAVDCTASDLTGGGKACAFGCLGYGECVDSCEFGAMAMNDNGLPVVFHDKCVGCGACVKACPRNIIEMHSEDHKLFVYCRNKEKGAKARKVCTVACIGCGLCVKDCSVEGGISLKDNLATVDNELAPQSDEAIGRCPTKCIHYGVEEKMTRAVFLATQLKKIS